MITALIAAFLVGTSAWTIDDPVTAPAVMLLAEQARADERVRLAGEMHDVVTHRSNLMVLRAGALRISTINPAARAMAEELRAAGCQAPAELRDLVGVLRERRHPAAAGTSAPVDEPTPAAFVDESRAVGLWVRLAKDRDPAQPLPARGEGDRVVVALADVEPEEHVVLVVHRMPSITAGQPGSGRGSDVELPAPTVRRDQPQHCGAAGSLSAVRRHHPERRHPRIMRTTGGKSHTGPSDQATPKGLIKR